MEALNTVQLRGRVAASAEERTLPSSDLVLTVRVIVDRPPGAAGGSRQRVDTIDCVAWNGRLQRSLRSWEAGQRVEVQGALRRRFFRTPTGAVSRVEVELCSAKRLRS